MPGWHEATKQWRENDELTLVGIIQEQHPERCRLFAQWKQFDWPILHDPINLLQMRAVPVTIAIDEHGVVRSTRPTPKFMKESFLGKSFDPPEDAKTGAKPNAPNLAVMRAAANSKNTNRAWRTLGDAEILWSERPWQAIDAYARAAKLDVEDAAARFRLGVAYRMRSESKERVSGDFGRAMKGWTDALQLDPNHYIYRRRIQQYGPRLGKPYPFYDWVDQARKDIVARGDKPIPLPVEPAGAEIASPSRRFVVEAGAAKRPDPKNQIDRDNALIEVETVTAPDQAAPGKPVRFHVELRPTSAAHWNNEAEPLVVWIEDTEHITLSRQRFSHSQPPQAESKETRRIEFEGQLAGDAPEMVALRGFALYYVCEEVGGTCLYRRQDFVINLKVRSTARSR